MVATAPGAWADALRQVVFDPFTKASGIAVRTDPYRGGIGILRTRVENGTNQWDLVEVPGDDAAARLRRGAVRADRREAPGRRRALPPGRDQPLRRRLRALGAGALVDRDKFQGTPSWADFWDIAKYPGKRGLRDGVRTNLESR